MATTLKQRKTVKDDLDSSETASDTSGITPSSSSAELNKLNNKDFQSLKERSGIPVTMYIIYGTMLILQYSSGFYSQATFQRWYSSMSTSLTTLASLLGYTGQLTQTLFHSPEDRPEWQVYAKALVLFIILTSLFYVFVGAPLLAGFWTGRQSKRHRLHRYAGLLYLTQYTCAWVEYFTNYESASTSFLPHCIAINGIIQGTSAYYSFKVLPALHDAGYYSDKAVLSRNFVHENMYFTLLAIFGSMYYYPEQRAGMQSNPAGRLVEFVFLYYPYVLVRPWFPITRFSNSGTTRKGRTTVNQRFYEIGTYMVKIFYLWAKYFLGFFINLLVHLELVQPDEWRVIRGLYLLNLGTVSLAVFLHTLRFKKVLPAKFTFSLYLVQIYLTFSGIPMALKMFAAHRNLCALCLAGMAGNMTRSRTVHALWCTVTMLLITQTDIAW